MAMPNSTILLQPPEKKNRRQLIWIFLLLAAINILLMPADWLPADPHGWFTEGRAIVRGHLDVNPQGAIPGLFLRHPISGKYYSKYGLASSLSVLPPLAAAAAVNAGDLTEVMLINIWQASVASFLGVLLYVIAGRYSRNSRVRLLYVVSCFYCTFLWFYIRAQGTELYQCVCFAVYWLAIVELLWPSPHRHRPAVLLSATWLSVLGLTHLRPTFVLLALGTAALLLWQLWRQGSFSRRVILGACLGIAMPLVITVGSLLAVNHIKFGAWYYTGYHIPGNGGASASFANLPDILGFVTDPHYSVFLAFPPLLLSLPQAWTFCKIARGPYVLSIAVVIMQACVVAPFGFWSGEWSEGPRYLLFALPMVSLPFVSTLDWLAARLQRQRSALLAAGLALLLAYSSFCWYQVIARPMFAWYRIVFFAGPNLDAQTARLVLFQPRGMFLWSLYNHRNNLDSHPYLQAMAKVMPQEIYAQYRQHIAMRIRPDNFFWRYFRITKAASHGDGK